MTELESTLEERVKKLERIMFTVRIAIIVLIGFMMYDALSPDTGSDIIYADKIKSREYVLLGSGNAPVGHWDYKDTEGFKLYSKDGDHMVLTPKALTFYKDKLNPEIKSTYD
ncbi:MAG: hypothetical protein AAF304_05830 [Pseudomonadota bacterium]